MKDSIITAFFSFDQHFSRISSFTEKGARWVIPSNNVCRTDYRVILFAFASNSSFTIHRHLNEPPFCLNRREFVIAMVRSTIRYEIKCCTNTEYCNIQNWVTDLCNDIPVSIQCCQLCHLWWKKMSFLAKLAPLNIYG